MSHARPVPDAAVAPYPAQPEPHGEHPAGAPAEKPAPARSDDRGRMMIAGAAVGIGSAAIAAALLYANRKPAAPVKAPKPVKGKAHKDKDKATSSAKKG